MCYMCLLYVRPVRGYVKYTYYTWMGMAISLCRLRHRVSSVLNNWIEHHTRSAEQLLCCYSWFDTRKFRVRTLGKYICNVILYISRLFWYEWNGGHANKNIYCIFYDDWSCLSISTRLCWAQSERYIHVRCGTAVRICLFRIVIVNLFVCNYG